MTDDTQLNLNLAADIRKVDGAHDLGASALADALIELGWTKVNPKDDASVDYPRLEGDHIILGPEIFTDAKGEVISWKGENFVKQAPVIVQPPLEQYKVGEQVEALKNGSWLPGKISSIEKYSHYLHVETERGPVTIGSSYGVRRPQS